MSEINVELQDDGQWLAEMPALPGVMALGETREAAIENLQALALRLSASTSPAQRQIPAKRDELPDKIHMVLCALFPLGAFFLGLLLGWPYSIAAGVCLLGAIASMFVLTPLTATIYAGITKIRTGQIPSDIRIHTTDAGCSALVFLVLTLLLFPVFEKARHQSGAGRQQHFSAPHQPGP